MDAYWEIYCEECGEETRIYANQFPKKIQAKIEETYGDIIGEFLEKTSSMKFRTCKKCYREIYC